MASPVPVLLDVFVLSYPLGFVRPNKILRAFIADWLTTIGLYLLTPLPPWVRKESQSEQEGNDPVEPASSQYACSELRCDTLSHCPLIFFPEEEGERRKQN